MDPQILTDFSRKLAEWATELIAEGRFPFRRAEVGLPLYTGQGSIAAPLVLWINRDSFMAGGVFLFPEREAEECLVAGSACAEALGLGYFASWSAREIVFWETSHRQPAPCWRLASPPAGRNDPEAFLDTLRQVLEETKMLAVAGNVPPAELSPWYLANLCLTTCCDAAFPLIQAHRVARGEGPSPGARSSPEDLALQQTTLMLLRLLALELEDRLPPTISPEGLQRALGFATDTLPAPLARPLQSAEWEIPLPDASAVRLHHLFRRLGQLRLSGDRLRLRRVIEILHCHYGGRLGGHPPPGEELQSRTLLVNSDRFCPAAWAEAAPAPLLAFTSLLRHLDDQPPAVQAANVFALGDQAAPDHVVGTLVSRQPPPTAERQEMAARLRLSWPNRRFPLASATPRWFWELLHLLGLAGDGARLDLVTPGDWLISPWATPLSELLREQFVLTRLERRPTGVRICLIKDPGQETVTTLESAQGSRELPWEQLRDGPRALLPLALDLDSTIFSQVESGRLQPDADAYDDCACERGAYLFARSSWGRHLWRIVSGGLPLPTGPLLPHLYKASFPLPSREVLRHLQQTHPASASDPSQTAIDAELAPWFGRPPSPGGAKTGAAQRPRRRRMPQSAELEEGIRQSVFVDGIPRFPEQYLYDYYRPQLREFHFSPPLTRTGDFFGQMSLTDADGRSFTVEGEETARALMLASQGSGSPVALPTDRLLTASLLERFLADLTRLHQALTREAYRHFADPRVAETVVERIWRSLPLPAWPPTA